VFLSLSGLATLADKLGDDGAGAGEGGAAGGVPGRAPSGELILPVPSFLQHKKQKVRFKRFRTQEYKNIEECKKLMAICSLGPVGQREPAITPQSYEEGSVLLLAKEEMRFYLSLSFSVRMQDLPRAYFGNATAARLFFCRRSARDIGT
jgi:hypothetical protein